MNSNEKLFVPVILGTAREERQSEKAARFVLEQAENFFETELIDVRDFRIKSTDNTQKSALAQKLSEKITKADGLIIVSAEYNFSYPGELKMMLDLLYRQYEKKPVGICGVSAGGFGGVRGVEQLKLVCLALKMIPISTAVYFSNISELFDDKGDIKDKSYNEKVKAFLEELKWYAETLKAGREKTGR